MKYRILFVHLGVGTVLFQETNLVPRVGDRVAIFTEYPFPAVKEVILWPEKQHLRELITFIEDISGNIDALIFMER